MAGFTGFDDFINSMTVDGKVFELDFAKLSTAAEASGNWHSLWRVGNIPSAGADGAAGSGTPGAGGTTYTGATGSLSLGWADTSPETKHIDSFEVLSSVACTIMVYDRLNATNISLVGTGSKNVGSPNLTRYTDGVGVEAWAEVTTVTATTAPIISMNSYTDQGGNTGAAGGNLTFPSTATNVDALIGPLPLASGDWGVRSVETINVSTASGGAGACNIVLLKPLFYVPVPANMAVPIDLVTGPPSLPRVYDGASLAIAFFATTTTAPNIYGKIRAVYS